MGTTKRSPAVHSAFTATTLPLYGLPKQESRTMMKIIFATVMASCLMTQSLAFMGAGGAGGAGGGMGMMLPLLMRGVMKMDGPMGMMMMMSMMNQGGAGGAGGMGSMMPLIMMMMKGGMDPQMMMPLM